MIRVLIVDDQVILRESLKFIIEQDSEIEVVGCAGNGLEALELCDRLLPDVVLMDIIMPECDGIEGTRLIKQKHSGIKIIILTTFNNDDNISKVLMNGADGYILKDVTPDELVLAIKGTAKGLDIIHKSAIKAFAKQFDSHSDGSGKKEGQTGAIAELTEREITIVRLIVDGKSNREISAVIHLTEGSVKNLITRILEKLNLKDRTQIAVYAVKNNLV